MQDTKKNTFAVFYDSDDYLASPELQNIVNRTIVLGKPLLIRGEPGT